MKRRRSQRPSGFTLVELMIALTISGVVIGAMYTVGSASSRHFQVQHQAANMQSALRFAMIQVKRDIQRAGYLATPNALVNDCGITAFSNSIQFGGDGWIAGISSFRNNEPNVVDTTGNNAANGFVNDEVTMVGNYVTSNDYAGVEIGNGANNLTLSIDPANMYHAMAQDFGWAANGTASAVVDPALIQRAFPVDGLIRIKGKNGMRHYATITSTIVAGNTIRLEFTPAIDPECTDESPDNMNGWVAPLQVIRYDAGVSAANNIQSDRATGAIAQLVRTQRNPRAKDTIMAGTVSRVVLDYLAAFDLSFTLTNDTSIGEQINPDDYVIGQSANNTNDQPTVNATPERIRAVTVTLAVRAPSTDPGMRFYNCQNLRCFQLNVVPAGGPAARVRVVRTEIFLPNIAYEGY